MQVHHNFFFVVFKKSFFFFKREEEGKNNWCFSASITGCQRCVIFRGVKNLSFSIIESTRQNVGRKNPLTITAAPEGGRRKVSCCACAQGGRARKLLFFFSNRKKECWNFQINTIFLENLLAREKSRKNFVCPKKHSYIFFSTFWG